MPSLTTPQLKSPLMLSYIKHPGGNYFVLSGTLDGAFHDLCLEIERLSKNDDTSVDLNSQSWVLPDMECPVLRLTSTSTSAQYRLGIRRINDSLFLWSSTTTEWDDVLEIIRPFLKGSIGFHRFSFRHSNDAEVIVACTG